MAATLSLVNPAFCLLDSIAPRYPVTAIVHAEEIPVGGVKLFPYPSPQDHSLTQKKGLTAIDGAMALIVVLLVVQIWLVMATLETYLAGHRGTVLAGAIISGTIFLACFGLYLFIERMDAEVRDR